MEIAFYEKERPEPERIKFVNFVKEKGIKYVHTNPDIELPAVNILFVHEPDFSDLKQDDNRGNQTIKVLYSEKWILLFGGNPSNFKQGNKGEKLVQYINYNDIKDRFDEIINDIENLTLITKEKLEEIIFGIDPELEKLLKDFAVADPFKVNSTLKEAKASLQNHINKLLAKPQ